jgi:4-diphosphocytidyl-2-C-methyl-D-erythritol kinase
MTRRTESAISVWPAPAKINLFLHVTGRRADGYHELQTLFQLLDWGDEVSIRATPGAAITRGAADYPVAAEEDLAIRAARLLQRHTECREGAEISVRKRIPLGSGMGGGSSNAATVLLALNRLWASGLGLAELSALGAGLGADVPVFVQGDTALATGIGDRLHPVRLGRRHYVLVFPGIAIGTREIFTDPELARDSRELSKAEALAGEGRNDCEAVVRKRFPAMAEAADRLQKWGRPRMTGTGSGIFLQMDSEKQARSAAREIKNLYNVRAVIGVDRSPLHHRLDSFGN